MNKFGLQIICALLFVCMVGCVLFFHSDQITLEEYTPEQEIREYYLLLDGGALRLGSPFGDTDGVFEVIDSNEKDGWVRYKQQLNMFDFETTDGIITAITIPSDMCMISSKYYVGMTESQLVSLNDNLLLVDGGYLDAKSNVKIEYNLDEYTQKITVLRFSTQRLKE